MKHTDTKRILNAMRKLPRRAKRVCIVGAGRIGSWTALALANAGIKRFVLVDDDKVSESNIGNGEVPYSFFDLDDFKVNALRRKVREIAGRADIEVYRTRVRPNMPHTVFESIFNNSALIIWAIDSREGLTTLERNDYFLLKPSIIPAMHAEAGGGHVVLWLPPITACPLHTLGLRSFNEIEENPAEGSGIDREDVMMISDAATKITEIMFFKRINDFWGGFDLERNYLHIERLRDGRYRRFWIRPRKAPNCILCNNRFF